MKKRWKILCLGLLALGLLYLHQHHHITAEEILSWQPENLFLAAVILLCFCRPPLQQRYCTAYQLARPCGCDVRAILDRQGIGNS